MRRPTILSGAARRVLSGDIDVGAFSEEEQSEDEEMPEVPTTPRPAPPSAAAPQIKPGKRSQQDRTPTIKSPNEQPKKSQLRVDGLDVASVADGADGDEGEPTGRLERREDDATGGVGSASDMSEEEEEDPNPFSLKKISEDLDDDWTEGEAFVAASSGIASGCARNVFGVLHTRAAGALRAADVRGVKPKYGAGIAGSDVCDAEQLPRPYQPPKPPKLLPEGNAFRSGRSFGVVTSSELDKWTLVRLRREMTFFLLERCPWLLRPPPSEDLLSLSYGAHPLRPLTVRCTKYSMRPARDVFAMIEDAFDLETEFDAASPTPRKKRGAETPLSRLERLKDDAFKLKVDPFAEAPELLSRHAGLEILHNAHAPKTFLLGTPRADAEAFWRRDPVTGLVPPRDAAVLDQALLPFGCMRILRDAWKKADGKVKPRLVPTVARQRAANYLNKNRASKPFPRPGFDGPLGVAELIMGYVYGGAPGGDHPDMPLCSLRMSQQTRVSVPLPPGATSDVIASAWQRNRFKSVGRLECEVL